MGLAMPNLRFTTKTSGTSFSSKEIRHVFDEEMPLLCTVGFGITDWAMAESGHDIAHLCILLVDRGCRFETVTCHLPSCCWGETTGTGGPQGQQWRDTSGTGVSWSDELLLRTRLHLLPDMRHQCRHLQLHKWDR